MIPACAGYPISKVSPVLAVEQTHVVRKLAETARRGLFRDKPIRVVSGVRRRLGLGTVGMDV